MTLPETSGQEEIFDYTITDDDLVSVRKILGAYIDKEIKERRLSGLLVEENALITGIANEIHILTRVKKFNSFLACLVYVEQNMQERGMAEGQGKVRLLEETLQHMRGEKNPEPKKGGKAGMLKYLGPKR